jgi:hypothetical protein
MGLIGKIFGGAEAVKTLGNATQGVAEIFTPNATRKMELNHEAQRAALSQLEAEMKVVRNGYFDSFVNGLNRLPRPLLALGTLGLFVYAMIDPIAFAQRMAGLGYIPDPLWWLLGAVVSFYFGAREMHYFRNPLRGGIVTPEPVMSAWENENRPATTSRDPAPTPRKDAKKPAVIEPLTQGDSNPALSAWQASQE